MSARPKPPAPYNARTAPCFVRGPMLRPVVSGVRGPWCRRGARSHASSRGVAGVRGPMLRPVVSPGCAVPCFVPWCRRGARSHASSRGVAGVRGPMLRPVVSPGCAVPSSRGSGGFGVVATVLCRPLGRERDPQVALDAGQPLTRVGESAAQLCVVLVDEVGFGVSLLDARSGRGSCRSAFGVSQLCVLDVSLLDSIRSRFLSISFRGLLVGLRLDQVAVPVDHKQELSVLCVGRLDQFSISVRTSRSGPPPWFLSISSFGLSL